MVNLKDLVASKKVQETLEKLAGTGETVVILPPPNAGAAKTDDK